MKNNHVGLKTHLNQIHPKWCHFYRNTNQKNIVKRFSSISSFKNINENAKDAGTIDTIVVLLNNGCLEIESNGTGAELFKTFRNVIKKYNLNWHQYPRAQSYDGAAAMQGTHSGVRTLIQKENPNASQIYLIWSS